VVVVVVVGMVAAAVTVVYIYPLFSGPAAPYLSRSSWVSDSWTSTELMMNMMIMNAASDYASLL
jgi:hypothetical protein